MKLTLAQWNKLENLARKYQGARDLWHALCEQPLQ